MPSYKECTTSLTLGNLPLLSVFTWKGSSNAFPKLRVEGGWIKYDGSYVKADNTEWAEPIQLCGAFKLND